MLNHITIMGRFTRDPELRHTQSGTAVTSFTLAVERDFKDKNSGETATDWISCTAWKGTAEFVSRYFQKGRMVIVDGRLQTRSYQDRDGNKRTAVEVVSDHVYFGDSKKKESEGNAREDELPENEPQGFSEAEDDGELPF